MRVLMCTFPIVSHYFPMVPLAWSLRTAGHSLRIACPPAFAPTVERSGLPALAVGSDVDTRRIWRGFDPGDVPGRSATEEASERNTRALRMFTAVSDAVVDDLYSHAKAWRPDLVVYEPRSYAGLIVAHRLGVPAVRHLWGTDYTRTRWPSEEATLAPYLAAGGLDVPDPFGALTLDPCPPSLQLEGGPTAWPMRYIPFNGSATAPLWLDEPPARPRVCLTWGTSPLAAARLEDFLRLLQDIDQLDLDLVLTVAATDRARPHVPHSIRLIESMPLHLLLSTCSALVHQGGSGTVLTALAYGVPQYVLPLVADGRMHGELLAARGAGRTAELGELDPADFRQTIETVASDPGIRAIAMQLRDEMAAQRTPAQIVQALEEWL